MTDAAPAPPDAPLPRRAGLSLALFTLVATFALIDKAVVAYLLEPVRHEFALSDAQLGLVSGLAFGLFFALAGVPLGLAADRVNRRNLVAACLALWSMMTAASGLAVGFVPLLLTRIGVGVGEAGAGPGILSMLADIFPPRRRATAMAIYALALPLGSIVAYLVAAHVLPRNGWRMVFLACAVPGAVLVPLVLALVSEPPRGAAPAVRTSLAATLRFVRTQRALVHLIVAITLTTMTMNGIGIWIMSFFIRVHHVDFATVGPILAFAYPVPAFASTLASGALADRLARRDVRWRAWVPAIGALACVPVALALVLVESWGATLAMWAAFGVTSVVWYGPGYALIVTLVAPRMRATLVAILFLLTNLIGYGLSPLLVGTLSDALAPAFGAVSLRYAMAAIALLDLVAAFHFARAARTLAPDIARCA